MSVRNYRELIAWQRAIDLVEAVYVATREFPREEIYGLTSQVRRAVVSVPSNIAEGQGRRSRNEFLHHLGVSYGSLCEVETQVLIAERLDYLNSGEAGTLLKLSARVGQLINGLSRSLGRA